MSSAASPTKSSSAKRNMSRQFRDPEADLTVRSSDGVFFKVFSKDLSAFSEAFPSTDITKLDTCEVVSLSEKFLVLELLFQFMRRQRQPNLDNIPFYTLAALAEAVEKYEVFTATEVCRIQMRAAVTKHPVRVLAYASRHGLSDLSDLAARLTIGESAEVMQKVLTEKALLAWFRYREIWVQCLSVLTNTIKSGKRLDSCPTWKRFAIWSIANVNDKLRRLQIPDFDEEECPGIAPVTGCRECKEMRREWKESTELMISQFPKFSTYL